MGRPVPQHALRVLHSHQIDRAFQPNAVDDDLDDIAVHDLAQRPARQRLRRNVPDAGPRRDPAEPRVRDHRHVLSEVEVLQRGGHLIDLLHSRARRAAARQHQDVARAHAPVLDRLHRRRLGVENARRASLAVDTIGVHHRRIDRGALDHRAIGRQVALRKRDGGSQAPPGGRGGVHDDVIRIDSFALLQQAAQPRAPFRPLPPVERLTERCTGGREHVEREQSQAAQMEHDLRHSARQEHHDRGEILRPVRQGVHQARDLSIHRRPVVHRGLAQAAGVRDRGHV